MKCSRQSLIHEQANKNHLQDLQTANEEYVAIKTEQSARLERAEEKAQTLTAQVDAANTKATKAESSKAELEREKRAVQTELDDLLMVFGDLEEKVTRYRDRLKGLGESVSDADDDDEDEEEEEGEDEDEAQEKDEKGM